MLSTISKIRIRGKGNKMIRKGRRVTHIPVSTMLRKQKGKESPNTMAMRNLNKEFENLFPGFEKSKRKNLVDEISGMNQLRFMNMKVLAVTLVFIRDNSGKNVNFVLTPEILEDKNIKSYLNILLPPKELFTKGKDIEKNRYREMEIQYKAELIRYIIAVIDYRAETNPEELIEEEEVEEREEEEEVEESEEEEEEEVEESEEEEEVEESEEEEEVEESEEEGE
mgnify:CR=1 FL=1|jgi:Cobalamin biosynthesis protein CobT (nicotinate-mononucleotide:5, 6-dimethylbenzimidazole phosphoribosyltransferase)